MEDIKKSIQRMGGRLGTKIHDKVAAIISTEAKVKKMDNRMQKAKELGIQVVPEEFLKNFCREDAIGSIIGMSLCEWGNDVRSMQMSFDIREFVN